MDNVQTITTTEWVAKLDQNIQDVLDKTKQKLLKWMRKEILFELITPELWSRIEKRASRSLRGHVVKSPLGIYQHVRECDAECSARNNPPSVIAANSVLVSLFVTDTGGRLHYSTFGIGPEEAKTPEAC